jgi:hypothetical protein
LERSCWEEAAEPYILVSYVVVFLGIFLQHFQGVLTAVWHTFVVHIFKLLWRDRLICRGRLVRAIERRMACMVEFWRGIAFFFALAWEWYHIIL